MLIQCAVDVRTWATRRVYVTTQVGKGVDAHMSEFEGRQNEKEAAGIVTVVSYLH